MFLVLGLNALDIHDKKQMYCPGEVTNNYWTCFQVNGTCSSDWKGGERWDVLAFMEGTEGDRTRIRKIWHAGWREVTLKTLTSKMFCWKHGRPILFLNCDLNGSWLEYRKQRKKPKSFFTYFQLSKSTLILYSNFGSQIMWQNKIMVTKINMDINDLNRNPCFWRGKVGVIHKDS